MVPRVVVISVHVSFSFVVLCGRSSRRRSREEPDREARPGTHEEMDDDEEEKAESLSNLNGLCLCSTGLVEMMLGRLLGAESVRFTCYSGFAWSPLGVGCHCMSEPICLNLWRPGPPRVEVLIY